VYITHQINVLAGFWTPITSWVHQRIIQKFDECWIPDEENSRFSGKLSQSSKKLNQRFIGVLSRFEKKNHEKSIDLLIVLSGPEPNRSQLEEKLIDKFSTTELNVCFVQGNVTSQRKEQNVGNLTLINYVLSEELEILLNTAKYVICRSGYSSIMDLAALGKSALLIPTKGQTEQEYLAKYHSKQNRFEVISESELKAIEMDVNRMSSEEKVVKTTLPADLFRLFQRE
jgi:predicted glycosyltransferase